MTKTQWNIRIEHATGENVTLKLPPIGLTLNQILREEIPCPVELSPFLDSFWLKSTGEPGTLRVNGNFLIEGQISPETPFQIGNSKLTIVPRETENDLPPFPPGATPWLARDPSSVELVWNTKKIARTNLSVYIEGETGTGKDVLASLIHAWSENASGPFIPLNCGALTATLAESELFGHTKGAFTGAHRDRPGALLQAHHGTLFLDEVADLSLEIQAKLLRFLENGEVRPVGSDRILHSQTRVICATHKPLLSLVKEGKFRRDLYYRLASLTLEIPALRHRPSDIEFFAREFSKYSGHTLAHSAVLKLKSYEWPGNVRELKHAIERASGMAGHFVTELTSEHFDFLIPAHEDETESSASYSMMPLHEMERAMLIRSLRLAGGNRRDAAKMLGIARSTLFDMMKRYKIIGPRMKEYKTLKLAQNQFSKEDSLNATFG